MDPDAVYCPTCGARPGERCVSVGNRTPVHKPHRQRVTKARKDEEATPLPEGKRRPTSTTPSAATRRRIRARSGGRCEAQESPGCPEGYHDGEELHHVIRRGQGGGHGDENLRWICGDAHRWIHANPAEARKLGLLASAKSDKIRPPSSTFVDGPFAPGR